MMNNESHEIRWFVPEDGAPAPRPRSSGRRRVDRYHLGSLTPTSAVKARGTVRLEAKHRVGRVDEIDVNGCLGRAERWVKKRPPSLDAKAAAGEEWIDVGKELWRARCFEVARITVPETDMAWWTIAVRVEDVPRAAADRRFAEWVPLLAGDGWSGAYPEWLLGVLCRSGEPLLA